MKRFSTTVAVASMLILLSGCGHKADGTVTGKHHEDGYYYTTTISIPCGNSTCMIPQQQWSPDSWTLRIDGRDCDTSEENYKHYNEGDHFKGDCD